MLPVLGGPSDPCGPLGPQITALLTSLRHAEKRKQLTSAQIDDCIPMLLAVLEQTKNPSVIRDVVLALKEIVSEHKGRARLLAEERFAASQVLLALLLRQRDVGPPEPAVLAALGTLLARLATEDNKFCTKARALGAYKVPLEELRKFRVQLKVRVSMLLLLKRLLGNRQNATLLGNEGLLAELFALLEATSGGLQGALALECLALATAAKRNVLELLLLKGAGAGGGGRLQALLALLDPEGGRAARRPRLARALLDCLLNVARHRVGRRELRRLRAPQLLWRWALTLGPGLTEDRLARSVCQLVHRCLPPRPLPVAARGPLHWPPGGDTVVTVADAPPEMSSQSTTSSEAEDHPVLAESPKSDHAPERVDLEAYAKFFPELTEKATVVSSAAEEAPSMEEPLAQLRRAFEHAAQSTQSLAPLVKLAFPEALGHPHTEPLEVLHACRNTDARGRMLEEVGHCLESNRDLGSFPVVYNYDALVQVPPSRPLLVTDDRQGHPAEKLTFESRFEGGNLRRAIQTGPTEYSLLMTPDINTGLHHRWFYFEVSGMRNDVDYKFNIINFDRTGSLYKEGQCPLLFSVREWASRKRGWYRVGHSISYQRNLHWRPDKGPLFTLSFMLRFPHASGDVCYLATAFPYGFSLLKAQLALWLSRCDRSSILMERQELCRTLAGNPVPLLTITAAQSSTPNVMRPHVFLTARVHPGETNSSWIMKGIIDCLLSDKPVAQQLRSTFVFKLVPMLNPDGVINGCHRCSLAGQDLNRQWSFPEEDTHPTIYHTKALLLYLAHMGRTPLVLCDFHGHSRHFNAFLYGCSPPHGQAEEEDSSALSEVLAGLLHEVSPGFALESCCFHVERSKEATARVTGWRQFGIELSYTYECSTAGCNQGPNAGYHFGVAQLEELGAQFCEALARLRLTSEGQLDLSAHAELLSTCRAMRRGRKEEPPVESTDSLEDEDDTGPSGADSLA